MSDQHGSGSKYSHLAYSHLATAALTGCFALGLVACKSKTEGAPIVAVASTPGGEDPAAANMAPPYTGGNTGGYNTGTASQGSTRVLGARQSFAGQSSGQNYGSPTYGNPAYGAQSDSGPYQDSPEGGEAPIIRQAPAGSPGYYNDNGQGYSDAEDAGAQAIAETDQAPPPLPEYDQPPAPEPNDLWTPGYWNYAQTGYYWVPGAWCAPPFYGALWTPAWWGSYGGGYRFHRGYWGHHVGYYGGINYGFGYIGRGYEGGYWHDRDFVYNRAVTNVNTNTIHNVYNRRVVYNGREYGPHPEDRVSYNGGRGGINTQPRPEELAAGREPHYPPVAAQRDLRLAAASNRGQFFGANGGRPAQAFAPRPVGSQGNIAGAPREQPFNYAGAGRPAGAGRNPATGSPNSARPGEAVGARPPFEAGRSLPGGAVNQTRPGPFSGQQPGTEQGRLNPQSGLNPQQRNAYIPGRQPGPGQERPGVQAGVNPQGRNSDTSGHQPGLDQGRAGPVGATNPQQPLGERTGQNPRYNHQLSGGVPPGAEQPRGNGLPPGDRQPIYNQTRPAQPKGGTQIRPVQPQGGASRPGFEGGRPPQAQPAPQPRIEAQRPAPQVGGRAAPAYTPRPQTAPQITPQAAPQIRPQVIAPRPQAAPAPAMRPAPAPAPAPGPRAVPAPAPMTALRAAPAPAGAPHVGGGGEHGHP